MNALPFAQFHENIEIILAHIIQDFMHFMKQHNLSSPQIHSLMYIYHAGECHVSDITGLADVSNAAASQMVERLVQQGLVDRREDPSNRRSKILTVSEKGKGLIRESVAANNFLMGVLASLSPDQHETVQAAFTILVQAARRFHNSNPKKDNGHASNA